MKHQITIDVDDSRLSSYSDAFLAFAWHLAQHNPAPHADYFAGELAEHIGREIIARWLRNAPVEMWRHQGRHATQAALSKVARYTPGDGYRQAPAFSDESTRAFHSGTWAVTPEAAASLIPGIETVVAAAERWHREKGPTGDVLRRVDAEKALVEAIEAIQQVAAPAETASAPGGDDQ